MIHHVREQSSAKWGGAGLGGPGAFGGAEMLMGGGRVWSHCPFGSCSPVEAAEHGAVGIETRQGMSVLSRSKLPGLFLSSPITTPPTRHLGRKGGMSNGKA